LFLLLEGHRCQWLSRKPYRLPTFRKRLSSARVSTLSATSSRLGLIFRLLISRTARGAKVPFVKEVFSSYGDKFEVVSVNDVAIDNISEHLNGVDAVIHAAAPLPGKGDPQALLNVSSFLRFFSP
jgi:hypothetical protein